MDCVELNHTHNNVEHINSWEREIEWAQSITHETYKRDDCESCGHTMYQHRCDYANDCMMCECDGWMWIVVD